MVFIGEGATRGGGGGSQEEAVDFWAAPGPRLDAVGLILENVQVHIDQRKISRNFCDQDFLI